MHSSGRTDTGIKRNNNQDSIFFSDAPVGPLPNLYIVADGMGDIAREIKHPGWRLILQWTLWNTPQSRIR